MINKKKREWLEEQSWIREKDDQYYVAGTDFSLTRNFINNHSVDDIDMIFEIGARLVTLKSWQNLINIRLENIQKISLQIRLILMLNLASFVGILLALFNAIRIGWW